MSISKLAVKLYASAAPENLEPLIPVFHKWIQEEGTVAGMPLDVADYRHVPDGPHVALIGHEADHVIDATEGDLGLYYTRKRRLDGSDVEKITDCIAKLVAAATILEGDDSLGFTFDARRIRLVFNDRLNHPNTEAGFQAVAPAIEEALKAIFGGNIMLERDSEDPRTRLIVHAATDAEVQLADLAAKLEAVTA